jgi:UDPglucose 6-dehydrogenase
LVTEWKEFAALDLDRLGQGMRARVLFDGRRQIDPKAAEAAGFAYVRVGSRGATEQKE